MTSVKTFADILPFIAFVRVYSHMFLLNHPNKYTLALIHIKYNNSYLLSTKKCEGGEEIFHK